jgi:putative tryptophan/tyrosine transport system substrate-binding protein
MNRRDFIALLSGATAAVPVLVSAQSTMPKIGLLDPGLKHLFTVFIEALAHLGYVEGNTISYLWRSSDWRTDQLQAFVTELIEARVDVIVTAGGAPIRAAMHATSTIPIVMAAMSDPVGAGFVKSLARPGGGVTGLSFANTETASKRLEILHNTFPSARRLAILVDRIATPLDAERYVEWAKPIGLEPLTIAVGAPEEFDAAFKTAVDKRAEIMDVLASPFFNANRVRLVEAATKYRLPAIYESREYVQAGGLMSHGADFAELFRRAATYVDKILKGAKPGDLPVEQATKFELVINLKTAKDLGVAIPPTILAEADEMIE